MKLTAAIRRALPGLLALLAACSPVVDEDRPPSVILISLDTLRADHMSLYGYERETTPYLERFAEECVVFDQAHSVAPWTLISHITMLTGLYPEQHGVVDEALALSPGIPLLAERLRDEGYQTYGFYYPGYVAPRHGFDRGFDLFEGHKHARQAQKHLTRQLAEIDRDRPLFMFLHLFDIHADPMRRAGDPMYDAPEPFDALFIPDARERLADVDLPRIRELPQGAKTDLTEAQLDALVALYDGKIRYVDSMLERWIENWRRLGLLDDTLVIITSDHGESLGQRGTIQGHGGMFEAALHIPMIVRFPDGSRAGEREDALVSLVDVTPTVLETCGLRPDPRLPGESLAGPFRPDRIVGAERPPRYARIRLPYKLVGADTRPEFVLDLQGDPLELEHHKRKSELFEALQDELEQAYVDDLASRPAFRAEPIPAESMEEGELAKLRALGYLSDQN